MHNATLRVSATTTASPPPPPPPSTATSPVFIDRDGKDPAHVISGLRAALKSPRVSKSAKERAARKLDGCAVGEGMPIEVEDAARASSEGEGDDVEVDEIMDPVTARSEFLFSRDFVHPFNC